MQTTNFRLTSILLFFSFLVGCGGGESSSLPDEEVVADKATLNGQLRELVVQAAGADGANAFMLPDSEDFDVIPQDPSNPISRAKVQLGQLLFHETALGTHGNNPDRANTYSCASCHHAAAGFKAGIPQGIGEGGEGFGVHGEGRVLADGFDASLLEQDPMKPDLQPLASPTVLNSAYQEVMLWNGQFGNPVGGLVNNSIDDQILSTAGSPKEANLLRMAGLETQAFAGLAVHRLHVEGNSMLQSNYEYRELYENAYGIGPDDEQARQNAAKAIAAFERTILANQAPFQQWLRGDEQAMSIEEMQGAALFFGKANCTACHRGPALSSAPGASAEQMFFAIGLDDLNTDDERVHGAVSELDRQGRGGFTGHREDYYKFKIPQLYNLADTTVFGHGASMTSIREVVEYKNKAIAQRDLPADELAEQFIPLNLSEEEVDALTAFLSTGLYDANLERYVPQQLPSGQCLPVNDELARQHLGCQQD